VQRVFIGDVQGCADELEELLAKIRADFGSELEVWLVGDLVNRGPANLRVLRLARELREGGRARIVMGNHDLAIVASALGLRPLGPHDTIRDVLVSSEISDWVSWIRQLPLVETGMLGACPFAMVHAAVPAPLDLAQLEGRARSVEARLGAPDLEEAVQLLVNDPARDPDRDMLGFLLRCRSVDERGAWSDAEPRSRDDAWHRRWAAHGHGYGVVYGHWSLQGLHVAPLLRGLDTGCVHHGRGRDGYLTAWVPDVSSRDPFAVPDERFVQVRAHRRYVREAAGLRAT
jgi:bis(5'-nucleosyl)-tetraphosphatase (symmetrical)